MADRKLRVIMLYTDFCDMLEHLTNDQKGILFQQIFDFVNNGTELETDDKLLLTVWGGFKKHLVKDMEKYDEICKKRSEAGKASAAKRKAAKEESHKDTGED